VAKILGLSPYGSGWQVWARLSGVATEGAPETQAQRRGNEWEAIVLDAYARLRPPPGPFARYTGMPVSRSDWPATCTPDAVIALPPLGVRSPGAALVEAKTDASGYDWGPGGDATIGTPGVREDYAAQCLWQIYVTGAEWCDLAVLLPRYDLRIFRFHASDPLIQKIASIVENWYLDHVISGIPHPPDDSDACAAYLARKYAGPPKPGYIAPTPEIEAACLAYAQAKSEQADAEKRASALRNQIIEAAGEAQGFALASGKFQVQRREGKVSLDTAALFFAHPELERERYERKGPPILALVPPRTKKEPQT